jgi:hypothetical protein
MSVTSQTVNVRTTGGKDYMVVRRTLGPRFEKHGCDIVSDPSVTCGLKNKSMIVTRTSSSSSLSRTYSTGHFSTGTIGFGSSESRFKTNISPLTYSPAIYRREILLVKTSDLHPVLPPQLEDRLLQLADRSRRLGAHRFSRSRNSLILNENTLGPSSVHQAPINRYLSPFGAYTSTKSSGTIQRVSLPRVNRVVALRE